MHVITGTVPSVLGKCSPADDMRVPLCGSCPGQAASRSGTARPPPCARRVVLLVVRGGTTRRVPRASSSSSGCAGTRPLSASESASLAAARILGYETLKFVTRAARRRRAAHSRHGALGPESFKLAPPRGGPQPEHERKVLTRRLLASGLPFRNGAGPISENLNFDGQGSSGGLDLG